MKCLKKFPSASKTAQIFAQLEFDKSVKSTFDDNIFLVTKTTGTKNKSIGFTRKKIARLLPEIQNFMDRGDSVKHGQ